MYDYIPHTLLCCIQTSWPVSEYCLHYFTYVVHDIRKCASLNNDRFCMDLLMSANDRLLHTLTRKRRGPRPTDFGVPCPQNVKTHYIAQ